MSSCYSLIYLLREPQLGRIIDCTVILQSVERSKRFRSFTLQVPITQIDDGLKPFNIRIPFPYTFLTVELIVRACEICTHYIGFHQYGLPALI